MNKESQAPSNSVIDGVFHDLQDMQPIGQWDDHWNDDNSKENKIKASSATSNMEDTRLSKNNTIKEIIIAVIIINNENLLLCIIFFL